MTEVRQVCSHYLSGNCKYGVSCTKVHISPSIELLADIEKKGLVICNYYPNCKFDSESCKKLHIDCENQYEKDMSEFRKLYLNIMNVESDDSIKLEQIRQIKFMIDHDIFILRDTWKSLSET